VLGGDASDITLPNLRTHTHQGCGCVLDDWTKSIPNLSMLGGWAVCTTSACQSESATGRMWTPCWLPGPSCQQKEGLTGALIYLFVLV
jgi:hypothetical protein